MSFEHSQTQLTPALGSAAGQRSIWWPVLLGLVAIPALLSLALIDGRSSVPTPAPAAASAAAANDHGTRPAILDGRGKWSGTLR